MVQVVELLFWIYFTRRHQNFWSGKQKVCQLHEFALFWFYPRLGDFVERHKRRKIMKTTKLVPPTHSRFASSSCNYLVLVTKHSLKQGVAIKFWTTIFVFVEPLNRVVDRYASKLFDRVFCQQNLKKEARPKKFILLVTHQSIRYLHKLSVSQKFIFLIKHWTGPNSWTNPVFRLYGYPLL